MKELNFKCICSFLTCKKRKYKASGYLLIALATSVVVSTVGLSVAKINHSVFSGAQGQKVAIQAQEYALTKVDFLRKIKYGEIAAQSKRVISNSEDYYDEIIVGAESTYPGDSSVKQKTCTVNVYKGSELLPRYSLQVVKLSKGEDSSLPSGSIVAWYGQIADIPSGFALCNGSNGTPDLRDRFIVGAGSSYALNAKGGANTVALSADQMPSHYHYHGYNYSSNGGMWPRLASAIQPNYPSGAIATKWNGSGGGNWNGWDSGGASYLLSNLITSLPYDNTGGTGAHENRPPYYSLYFIMKI